MSKVSVIMPVYNGENFIEEAIGSILNQTYSDWELICIDDGSTDGSKEIIRSFNDKRIRYFYQKNFGSPARGRNLGIKVSNGDYIAFIDQDDIYLPESISERIKCFIKNPKICFVYSDCMIIDAEGKEIHDSIIRYTNKIPFSGWVFKELFSGIFIPIQAVMIKKKVFDNVGMFNEKLVGTDDYEMWLRISCHYPITYLNKALAKWRDNPTSLSHNQHQMDENFANCLESVLRQFPDSYTLIGARNVRKRMYALSIDVAYGCLIRGEWNLARKWLKKSWYWGRKPKTLVQLLISYCTPLAQRCWSVEQQAKSSSIVDE